MITITKKLILMTSIMLSVASFAEAGFSPAEVRTEGSQPQIEQAPIQQQSAQQHQVIQQVDPRFEPKTQNAQESVVIEKKADQPVIFEDIDYSKDPRVVDAFKDITDKSKEILAKVDEKRTVPTDAKDAKVEINLGGKKVTIDGKAIVDPSGKVLYANGGIYIKGKEGEFKKIGTYTGDVGDGYGILEYPNGFKYKGEFKNGRKEGFGLEIRKSKNEKSAGEYQAGQKSGKTAVYNIDFKDGKTIKPRNGIGAFITNVKNGKITASEDSVIFYASGALYKGPTDGFLLKNGKGGTITYLSKEGEEGISSIKCDFERGAVTESHAEIVYVDGRKYIGEINTAKKPNGKGVMMDPAGNVIHDGLFANGEVAQAAPQGVSSQMVEKEKQAEETFRMESDSPDNSAVEQKAKFENSFSGSANEQKPIEEKKQQNAGLMPIVE